jgi:hypothetical protein
MGMTSTEGSHGNPHPTARIHVHAWRRCGSLADHGARAAVHDASDRLSSSRITRSIAPTSRCLLARADEVIE